MGHHQPPGLVFQSISLNKTKNKTKITNKTNRNKTKHSIKHKKREYNEHNKNKRSPLSLINSHCQPDSPFHSFARPTGEKTPSPLTLKGRRQEQIQISQVPLSFTPGHNLSDGTFHSIHGQIHASKLELRVTRQEQEQEQKKKKKRFRCLLPYDHH